MGSAHQENHKKRGGGENDTNPVAQSNTETEREREREEHNQKKSGSEWGEEKGQIYPTTITERRQKKWRGKESASSPIEWERVRQ